MVRDEGEISALVKEQGLKRVNLIQEKTLFYHMLLTIHDIDALR